MNPGGHLSEVQAEALESMSIVLAPDRWVLIGAAAIGFYVKLPRTTEDLDFVVATDGETIPPRLAAAGWTRHPKKLQTWARGHASIDVLPATEEDLFRGEVRLGEDFVLSVVGFDLAFEHCVRMEVRPGQLVHVPTLPVLALLKMISWQDKPTARLKDLGDFRRIIENALPDDADCRFDPEHPVCRAGLDHDAQGAFWVGHELGQISQAPHVHWAKRFLDRMRDDHSTEFGSLCNSGLFTDDGVEERLRARLEGLESGLEAGGRLAQGPVQAALPAPVELFAWRRSGSREMVLHDAIDHRRVVRFRYDGLERVVEPHVLGTRDGRLQVLTWQLGGASSSGRLPAWRLFFVDDLLDLELTEDRFAGPRATTGRHRDFDRQIAVVR